MERHIAVGPGRGCRSCCNINLGDAFLNALMFFRVPLLLTWQDPKCLPRAGRRILLGSRWTLQRLAQCWKSRAPQGSCLTLKKNMKKSVPTIQENKFLQIHIRQRNVASQQLVNCSTVPVYISCTLVKSKVWRSVDQWYLRCPGDTSRCLARPTLWTESMNCKLSLTQQLVTCVVLCNSAFATHKRG